MAYTRPKQTNKVLNATGNVPMQAQMHHASLPHSAFRDEAVPSLHNAGSSPRKMASNGQPVMMNCGGKVKKMAKGGKVGRGC